MKQVILNDGPLWILKSVLRKSAVAAVTLVAALALLPGGSAWAASASWNVDAAGNWNTTGSWDANGIPGIAAGTTSTDIATFGFLLTADRIVTVDTDRNIGGISFGNTSVFKYTLQTGPISLTSGGVIQTLTANGNHTDTISAPIAIQGNSGSATFTAGATSTTSLLNIGAVTGVSTSGNVTALTLNGTNTGANTVSGIIGDGAGGGQLAIAKSGAGAWVLSGANTYTGATTIGTTGATTSGGTLTVSGASGSISGSSAVTVNGTGSLLNLDYIGVANGAVDRVGSVAVTLNYGGELRMNGTTTAATSSSETMGTLTLGTGNGIVTINNGGSGVSTDTLTAGAFARGSNFSTALFRGSNLGLTANANSKLILTSLTGLTQIGTATSSSGVDTGTVKNLTIVPYLIGASAGGGVGSNFVTYDTLNGLRRLGNTEQSAISSGTTGDNVRTVAGANAVTGAQTFNSLLLSSGGTGATPGTTASTVTGDGNSLTLTSGALANVATTAAGNVTVSGFSSIIFGTTGANEAVITNANTTAGGNLTIGSPINTASAGGGLTKGGGGILILSASNLYTGQTTVNQGTLQIGSGTTGDLGSNTAAIALNGGNLLFARTNAGLTLAGNITGVGTVTQNGAGGATLLSGTNTYAGVTVITSGTLQLGNASALGATTGSTTIGASGILDLNGQAIGAEAVALSGTTSTGALINSNATTAASLSGAVTITASTFIGGAGNLTLSGPVSSSSLGFSKVGNGTLLLSGNNTGLVVSVAINGGTLQIGNSNALGGSGSGGTTVNTGTVLDLNGFTLSEPNIGLNGTGISGGGALINSNTSTAGGQAGTVTLGVASSIGGAGDFSVNTLAGAFNVTKVGAGTVTLNSAATAARNATIDGGVLKIANASSISTGITAVTTINSGTLEVAGVSLNQPITFNNGATLRGSGTTSASSGVTTVAAGASTTIAAVGSGNIFTVGNGANDITGGDSSSVIHVAGLGTVLLSQDSNYVGNWSIDSGTTLLQTSAAALGATSTATLTLAGGELRANYATLQSFTAGAGNNVSVTANSTITSDRTTAGAGLNYTFGTLGIGASTLNILGGATNVTSGQAGVTFGATTLSGNATFNVTNPAGGGTTVLSLGAVSGGSNTFTKNGNGRVSLLGVNTYSGNTTINGGTLALVNSATLANTPVIKIASGAIFDVSATTSTFALGSAQTLTGTGTVAGAMIVNGTLSPGNSPGTLFSGSETWMDNANYNFQILDATGAAGTGYDTLSITGGLDLSNLTTLGYDINLWTLSSIGPDVNGNASNFSSGGTYSWILASTTTGVTGFSAGLFDIHTSANNGAGGFANFFTGNFSVGLDLSGNNLVLNYDPVAVPEPSTYAFLAFGGLLYFIHRSRNLRRS